MERLLNNIYDLMKNEILFYTNAKYFELFSKLLLIQYKNYESLLTKGTKIIPFKKRKKIIELSSKRIPLYSNLYSFHHKTKSNLWKNIIKAISQINPITKVNELTTKYIKTKATVILDKILDLIKTHKFIFSKETIVKYYLYLCKKEIFAFQGDNNIYNISITREDEHIIDEMKYQVECKEKFNNKKNIVTQYFLSCINSGLITEDNQYINKFNKESMLKSVFNSLNKGKTKKKIDGNKTTLQKVKYHKYIKNLSCSNVKILKLPENNKTDERLLSKETICCLTEKRENSNSSNKTRKFQTLLNNYYNCSYKLGSCSSRKKYDFSQTSSKKSTANNSFIILTDALRSKIGKTKLYKKKLIIMPNKTMYYNNINNTIIHSPMSFCKTKRQNSKRILSYSNYQSQSNLKLLKLRRQQSVIDYMSKNDFYYS